jgi:hypothetical protein
MVSDVSGKRTLASALAIIIVAAGGLLLSACGSNTGCVTTQSGTSLGGFGGCVTGDVVPAQTAFQMLGDVGTPFTARISDTQVAYIVNGTVPLSVILVNSHPPIRMDATKLANDSALLSLQITFGAHIRQISSTQAPYGSVSVQTDTLNAFPELATYDVRFMVKEPAGQPFQTLIEDTSNGFQVAATAPVLLLFEGASGRVDGEFQQLTTKGIFDIDLFINGSRVANVTGGSHVTIKSP